MSYPVVITTHDLKIVEVSKNAGELIPGKRIRNQDRITDCFPTLKPLLTKEILSPGGCIDAVNLGNKSYQIRIIPTDNLIVFIMQENQLLITSDALNTGIDELKKRNILLESIIEEAPVGLFLLNEDGTIIYMNRKQEENSRKKRGQLINQDIRAIYNKAFENPQIREFFNKVMNNTEPNLSLIIDHYYPQFYKKDMIIKFLVRRLIEHKKIALFVEIEEELYREKRKAEKAGEELRMSRSYLTQLLDASPNMVISVDSKRRIVSFNKTAERLLGFNADNVYNSPVDRFFPKEELPKLDLAVSSQVLWYGTFHIFRADRSTFQIELYSTKIRDDRTGNDIATLLLAVNIEDRNKLRKNLIQSQKMNFIGELVSGLAHQINNPLVGVVNIADVLLQKIDKNDDTYPYVRMIREAGESCKEVISSLLRFSRRQEGRPRIDIDIRNVLNASIDMLLKHPKLKDVHVEKRYENVPFIHGDPVLLQQAFLNMLVNSAQAYSGSGIIRVECRSDHEMERQISVDISDNGCGIPEEDIPRIFEPFFSTKSADEGTGIGLSLAYWIIQDHGGRISVESAQGKGTTFTTFLPVKG